MRTVVSPDVWEEIRTAYRQGRSANQLARKWGISTSAIYRRAVRDGWGKQARLAPEPLSDEARAYAPAHRQYDEPAGEEGADLPYVDREGPDLVGHVLTGEMHEPGFLARIAIGASGEALRNYEFDDARTLIRLANEYARVADRCAKPNLHTIVRALFDRSYADSLFEVEEGEMNVVKDIYWTGMREADALTAKRIAKEAAVAAPSPAEEKPANAC